MSLPEKLEPRLNSDGPWFVCRPRIVRYSCLSWERDADASRNTVLRNGEEPPFGARSVSGSAGAGWYRGRVTTLNGRHALAGVFTLAA